MTRIVPSRHWDFEGEVDPVKGPKGDTAFLKDNYRFMQIGSIFRTPKARFSEKQIRDGAKKAGFAVEVTIDGPWWKVKAVGKLPRQAPVKPKQDFYLGAGKKYPDILL